MSGRMVLSDKDEATAAEFVDSAEQLAKELLDNTKLFIWRGKQKTRYTGSLTDTLIVSKTKPDWGKEYREDSYLLLAQRDGMGATIECNIGTEHCSSSVPFGGGHSPIKTVEVWLEKLAYLDLTILGNTLVQKLGRKLDGLSIFYSIQSYIWGTKTAPLYRLDVVKGLNPQDELYVTFVLHPTGNVIVLTPARAKGTGKLHEVARHQYDQSGENHWLDAVLLCDAVLEELTSE